MQTSEQFFPAQLRIALYTKSWRQVSPSRGECWCWACEMDPKMTVFGGSIFSSSHFVSQAWGHIQFLLLLFSSSISNGNQQILAGCRAIGRQSRPGNTSSLSVCTEHKACAGDFGRCLKRNKDKNSPTSDEGQALWLHWLHFFFPFANSVPVLSWVLACTPGLEEIFAFPASFAGTGQFWPMSCCGNLWGLWEGFDFF